MIYGDQYIHLREAVGSAAYTQQLTDLADVTKVYYYISHVQFGSMCSCKIASLNSESHNCVHSCHCTQKLLDVSYEDF